MELWTWLVRRNKFLSWTMRWHTFLLCSWYWFPPYLLKTSHQSSELKFVLSFLVILFAWASIFHAMKQLFFTTKWSWNFVVGRWHLICGSVSLELLASNLWVCFSWIIYSLKLNCFISWILEKFFRRNEIRYACDLSTWQNVKYLKIKLNIEIISKESYVRLEASAVGENGNLKILLKTWKTMFMPTFFSFIKFGRWIIIIFLIFKIY